MTHLTGSLKKLGGISCIVLTLSVSAIALSGCDLTRNHLKMDRSGMMDMQDYRDALASRVAEEKAKADMVVNNGADIPALEPYVAGPSEDLKAMPLVSISINQTVPLRDALFELASQANYDIELDPRITGSIIFTARDKPFDQVIQRIADISKLRYKFEKDTLRVELDAPYPKTYKIDYLSYVRKNTSSIKNDISVVSGEGANTGSKFEAAGNSEADFWAELNTNLSQILDGASGAMMTSQDPTITAAAQSAPVATVAAPAADGQPAVNVQAPNVTLNVQSLPTTNPNQSQTGGANGQNDSNTPTFAINKQAGMISVNANERQQKQVENYLNELRRSVTAQVLIEAKILEVSLSDEFSTGINWSLLEGVLGGDSVVGLTGAVRSGLPDALSTDKNLTISTSGTDFSAILEAVSRFGTVKALSSPRLTVLNNQSAVLNVANNQVYFEVNVDVTAATTTSPQQISVDSEIHNVPEGVLINVQPSIDLDDQSISMSVRPTITRIIDRISDPSVAFASASLTTPIESLVPVVNIQEMDSVVKVGSGQALLMGGLMQDRTDSEQQGVPVLSEIPMFGAAFRKQVDAVSKTELVIYLRATIIDGSNIDNVDRDIYDRFSEDRRPLKF